MKKRKKLVIIIAVILVLAALLTAKTFLSAKNTVKTVNTADAIKTKLTQSISVTGNIKAGDSEEILLPSTQKVTEVLVQEGQEVKKGQLLVKLDTYELESQLKKSRISLDMAKRDLEKLNSEDNTTRKSLENAVTQAEISLKSATSKYEDTRIKHEQNTKLYEAGFLSKVEFDNSLSTLNELQNNLLLAEIALDNARNSLADFDEKAYQQEKQIEISSTDLASLEKKIADSSIKANINGKIVKLDAKENQYPAAGSSIVIHDQSRYILELKVNLYDAVNLEVGQKANITVRGLDKVYEGHITKISDTATVEMVNTNKETNILVEITLDSVDEQIKAGYEAEAEIVLVEKENTVAVGFEAIQTDEQGNKYLFVVENNIAKKRIVQTGLETDFEIEILSGLKEGEKYIVSPPEGLTDGETVITTGGV